MPNLSALSNITTAATSLSNLVLVTPSQTKGYQPLNAPNKDGTKSTKAQPKALLFHYEGEQSVSLQSDITDHYVEDNTAIQDQIALKPEEVTTKGYIGELNNVPPPGLDLLKVAADKLTAIGAYEPQLSTTALIAYSQAFFLYQVAANVANSAVAAWSSVSTAFGASGSDEIVSNSGVFTSGASLVQNKQQDAFKQFYGYWRTRTLFDVQTPWAIFTNMAIKSIRPVQDADTRMVSYFEITFKKIRTAQSLTSSNLQSQLFDFQGRSQTQDSSLADQGTSSGGPADSPSLTSSLTTMGA